MCIISDNMLIVRCSPFRGIPLYANHMSWSVMISKDISRFSSGNLLSLRSQAHAVTLSGFAGGEFLPLRRSKGAAFPSCSSSRGTLPLPQCRSGTRGFHKMGEFLPEPAIQTDGPPDRNVRVAARSLRGRYFYPSCQRSARGGWSDQEGRVVGDGSV